MQLITTFDVPSALPRLMRLTYFSQTRTLHVAVDALAAGSDPSLPPLMNPAMLEASDDLTNLSHLNEPAGVYSSRPGALLRRQTNSL